MTEDLAAFEAHLKELMEIISTSSTPGWMRIMKRLEEMAQDSMEDLIGAGDKPDIVLAALARRYVQREAMVRDVKQYIASCQTEKDAILQTLDKERSSDAADRAD